MKAVAVDTTQDSLYGFSPMNQEKNTRPSVLFAAITMLMVQGCIPESDWSELRAFDEDAECGVNPIDLLQGHFSDRLEDIDAYYDDPEVDLKDISISANAPFLEDEVDLNLPSFLSDVDRMRLRWRPEGSVIGSLHSPDDNWYLNPRGGYFCTDGTIVYDFSEASLVQFLIIGDMDLTLAEDVRYMRNPTIISVYNNCPYDPKVPFEDYGDECEIAAEEIQADTSWTININVPLPGVDVYSSFY